MKAKRILAMAGVILLVGLYLITLIFALIKSPWAFDCLKISIGLTILIPVFLWICVVMANYITERRQQNLDATSGMDDTEESHR